MPFQLILKTLVSSVLQIHQNYFLRLCHENIILYGYDNNSKIIKNNTYVNFLEIEKLLELSDLVLFVVPSNDEIFDIINKYKLKKNSIFLDCIINLRE